MKQTKNLGLNITDMTKDGNEVFNFDTDLGYNFNVIDTLTLSHRNITNCVLEIPQNIKLELADGVLTLKEGSKLYRPGGSAGVFEEITLEADVSNSNFDSSSNQIMLFYRPSTNSITWYTLGFNIFSGANAPTAVNTASNVWYDTTYNIIKRTEDSGATWTNTNLTLPIAIVTRVNGVVTSIDQVFNGIGFMGSTVFALPGIKGLIPNGRNEDGTLNNTEFTLPSVKTYSRNLSGANTLYYDETIGLSWTAGNLVLDDTNYFIDTSGVKYSRISLATLDVAATTYAISNLNPKYPFQGVDYNDYQAKIAELETKIQALQDAITALQG